MKTRGSQQVLTIWYEWGSALDRGLLKHGLLCSVRHTAIVGGVSQIKKLRLSIIITIYYIIILIGLQNYFGFHESLQPLLSGRNVLARHAVVLQKLGIKLLENQFA